MYPLSETKVHCLCGASQGKKGTRYKGTAYGYRALIFSLLKDLSVMTIPTTNKLPCSFLFINLNHSIFIHLFTQNVINAVKDPKPPIAVELWYQQNKVGEQVNIMEGEIAVFECIAVMSAPATSFFWERFGDLLREDLPTDPSVTIIPHGAFLNTSSTLSLTADISDSELTCFAQESLEQPHNPIAVTVALNVYSK